MTVEPFGGKGGYVLRRWVGRVLCLLLVLGTACAAAEVEIVMTFGGDAVLGTREEWKGNADNFDACIEANGFQWPFALVADIFKEDDLTLVNLENVLQANKKGLVKDKQYRFRGDPSYTEILTVSGIESVNIANNHYIDYSASGRESTRKALADGGIAFSGYEFLYVFEKDGYKIGFGGCRETVYRQKKAVIKEDIRKLREMGCDVVVYSCHWGKEYSPTHNSLQKKMAQYVIDCGADIIIGTHPHCVQGIESVKNVPVVYSLGNLMFGGTHDMRTFDAFMVRAHFRFGENGYEGVELKPIPVLTSSAAPENNFQTMVAEGEDHARIMKLIQKDSKMKITESMWFPAKK